MPILATLLGLQSAPNRAFAGHGYLAGEPPATEAPGEPDGRFKLLNVPSAGRILIFERGTGNLVAGVFSAADGTWRAEFLNQDSFFTVVGYDDTGNQNAAIQDWVKPAPMD